MTGLFILCLMISFYLVFLILLLTLYKRIMVNGRKCYFISKILLLLLGMRIDQVDRLGPTI